jgi:hypothetical protein
MKRLLASFLVAVVALPLARQADGQGIGDRLKKKASEAVKGKSSKPEQGKTVAKEDGPIQSAWDLEKCGPLTPDKLNDFLRGLKAEAVQRTEFDAMLRGLRTQQQVLACRNQEVMSPTAQKILNQGMGPDASTAQLTKAMEKNRNDLLEHMDKKCGKDPSQFNQQDAYRKAHSEAAKAAGMSEACYDKLKEVVLGFCALTPQLRNAAVQNGIKAPGYGSAFWVFTAGEAQALEQKCAEVVPAIESTGYKAPS